MNREVPALVPARMLNEYFYCPRLFHLEWVQGEFAPNEETVHGTILHEAVDTPPKRSPKPGADSGLIDRPMMALDLDAPVLGMVAKMDVVETSAGIVTPVERKRGRPRPDGTVWEPEEMQAVAQALILRENGYSVESAVVWFPQARARVDIPITVERETRLRQALRDLRRVARGPCPPPLRDSPKCPRCSLVGICLPDETRAIVDSDSRSPVRLLVPADDAKPLFVQEQGARIGVRGDRIEVSKGQERLASVRSIDVSSVALFGNATVSAPALRAFCQAGVAITHHTYGGWLTGVTTGGPHKNIELRIRQFAAAADDGAALALSRAFVAGKVKNQRTLLRRNAGDDVTRELTVMHRLLGRVARARDSAELLGLEGLAAREYFGQLPSMLRPPAGAEVKYVFAGRNRRPPRDPVNALLSFAYSLLVREVVTACVAVGLDPYLGFFHRPRYGRPALALDLAEEFRPIVADSVVLSFVNNGEGQRTVFISRAGAYALSPNGRRSFIAAFERRLGQTVTHPRFGYPASYRRIMQLQARLLARALTGDLPEYEPFVTR